ncbi:MAG: pantoate--beta-alanine ligase [Actinobacteria bacterium]|nr:pantoate--beta-alanine ligase [Actinomycetota bacterium]
MILLRTPDDMLAWSKSRQASGKSCGFVPTMGALHDGHMALMRIAREQCDVVVVSIFVNPTQFNQPADFETYPRPESEDLAVCKACGVDAVFMPTAELMYPNGYATMVLPEGVADSMEGASRPGHFAGVATIVTKLFNCVAPDRAYFGEKDFQQLAVVKQLVRDLNLGVHVIPVSTVRDHDGLALSSRNARLSEKERVAAGMLPTILTEAQAMARDGHQSSDVVTHVSTRLRDVAYSRVDYVTIVDGDSLATVDTPGTKSVLAIAVWVGDVRLIDNVSLLGEPLL